MPIGKGKTYRFANASGRAPTFNISNSVLTDDNHVVIGFHSGVSRGSILFNADQDYTGTTLVHPGATLALPGDVALTGTSEVLVKGELSIPGISPTGVQRIPEESPLKLAGGTLRLSPNAATAPGGTAVNGLGPILLVSGRSSIFQGRSAGFDQEFYQMTEIASLMRTNRSVAYVATPFRYDDTSAGLRDVHIGTWRDTGDRPSGNRIFLDTPPVLVGGIIPYLYGSYGWDINPSLYTYEQGTGLRVLRRKAHLEGPSEFSDVWTASDFLAITDEDANVSVMGNTEHMNVNKTINSLVVHPDSGTWYRNYGVTTVKSGVILGGQIGRAGSVIDVGDVEGFFVSLHGVGTMEGNFAGNNGFTFAGTPLYVCGANTYTGQTTIAGGIVSMGNRSCGAYSQFEAGLANVSMPDDGFVLVHPGARLVIGDYMAFASREIIGSLGGGGTIHLGYTTRTEGDAWMNSALVIGEPKSQADTNDYFSAVGCVLLNGGAILPGMDGLRGTLHFATEGRFWHDNNFYTYAPYPVELRKGTVGITIDKDGESDAIAVDGTLTIGAGSVVLDVTVEDDAAITEGDKWVIATAGEGIVPIGGNLFSKVTSTSPKWTFEVEKVDNTLVMTACKRKTGTVILVR